MADIIFDQREKIEEIINESNRLRFLLLQHYKITLADISAIRVDSDNFKIDVYSNDVRLRFKAKGTENVLLKDPASGIMKLTFDPALAQAIYEITSDYATT
ncbi:MAG: hypothetical protein ACPGJS_05575 [Flammeovirgaceae bacterium]